MTRLGRSLLMIFAVAGLAGVALETARAADGPVGWRGDGSGQYPSSKPATKWSESENILWKAEVGVGTASAVPVGSRVFITAEPDLLICLDAETGKEHWRRAHKVSDFPAAVQAARPTRPHEHGDANPTPVSDGKSVWAFFGSGVVACYDLNGKARWVEWFDAKRTTEHGRTASPLLVGERLLVHLGPLFCLEAASGKVLWKSDKAKATYGTPVLVRIGDVDLVITPGGDAVRVSDGKVLAADLGHCMYASPIVQGRIVYFIDASSSAVQLPETAGEHFEGKELWYEDVGGEIFASAIVHGGRIHIVSRSAEHHVLDAATGKSVLKQTLELPPAGRNESPNVYPSLSLAGKHLFIGNDGGETILLEADGQGAAVGSNKLPAGSRSTPVFAGQRMFARGGRFLYCVGER